MKCTDCPNIRYCETRATEPEPDKLIGCTNGIPGSLPSVVAENLARKVRKSAKALNIDADTYLNEIIAETRKRLNE